jgi:hypothetical protein
MRWRPLLFCIPIVVMGCVDSSTVDSSVFTQKTAAFGPVKSFTITSPNKDSDLPAIAKLVADKLVAAGWTQVSPGAKAETTVQIAYGIDRGSAEQHDVPVYGQTTNGGFAFGTFGESIYIPPQYGQVGTSTETETVFTRKLAIAIVDNASKQPIFHSELTSKGSVGVFATVAACLVDASFQNFGNPPNGTVQVTTPGSVCNV